MVIWVLTIDKMIITQTFTMARWQIVVKRSEATKQTKDQNNNKNKQPNNQNKQNKNPKQQQQQNGRRGAGGKKQVTNRMVQ